MLAAISSATLLGVQGHPVTVEVHVGQGLPGFRSSACPTRSCRESRDRVRAAVLSQRAHLAEEARSPSTSRRRASARSGAGLDLAIAIGVLVADQQLPAEAVAGDRLRRRARARRLAAAGAGRRADGRRARRRRPPSCPCRPRREAAGRRARRRVRVGVHAARGRRRCSAGRRRGRADPPTDVGRRADRRPTSPTCAASPWPGGRSRSPPPAATTCCSSARPARGKTMLAQRLPGLLPPLDASDCARGHDGALGGRRAPAARRAGQSPAVPGARTTPARSSRSSAAARTRCGPARSARHGGVLFLDELGEFARRCSTACASRSRRASSGSPGPRPRRAAGPVPARRGHQPVPVRRRAPGSCQCDDGARLRYLRRLSGPLLDRFDLRVAVQRPRVDELLAVGGGEPTAVVARAGGARLATLALERAGRLNATLQVRCSTSSRRSTGGGPTRCCASEIERERLTGRGYHRIRRVARTIADLAGRPVDEIDVEHVEVALSAAAPRLPRRRVGGTGGVSRGPARSRLRGRAGRAST